MEAKFILIIFLILMSTSVVAKDYYIDRFAVCYGDASIRVEHNTDYPFEVKPCGQTIVFGTCPCKKNTTYYLSLPDNATGNFNVFITYFIKPKISEKANTTFAMTSSQIQNEMNTRTNTYLINAGPDIPPKLPFTITPTIMITFFIVLTVLIISVIFYFIIKKLKQDDD